MVHLALTDHTHTDRPASRAVRPIRGATRAAPAALTVQLGAIDWSIECVGCDEVALALASILTGWQITLVPGAARTARSARVTRHRKRYRWTSDHSGPPVQWREDPIRTANEVLYDLHDIAIDWYLADHPDELCLHAAAAEIDGRLIVFPSVRRAGKSTLMAALAAAGARVFGDDVIAVVPASGEAIALGFAPRLRLPLPDTLPEPLRAFVGRHAGAADHRWLYLALVGPQFAAHGTRRAIDQLVLLDRTDADATQPALEPVAAGAIVAELVQQNIAPGLAATAALAAWHQLATRVPCHRLSYTRLDDAVAALRARPAASRSPSSPVPRSLVRQAAGFQQRTTADGTVFLARRGSQEIHQLDPLAATLWRALRRHRHEAGLVDIVAAAFPATARGHIERDIAVLVASLTERGLLVRSAG